MNMLSLCIYYDLYVPSWWCTPFPSQNVLLQDGLDGPDRNQILESGKSGLHVVGPSQNSGPIGLASGILGAHSQLPLSSDSMHLTSNPIDKLYLMQDSYFTHMWSRICFLIGISYSAKRRRPSDIILSAFANYYIKGFTFTFSRKLGCFSKKNSSNYVPTGQLFVEWGCYHVRQRLLFK